MIQNSGHYPPRSQEERKDKTSKKDKQENKNNLASSEIQISSLDIKRLIKMGQCPLVTLDNKLNKRHFFSSSMKENMQG